MTQDKTLSPSPDVGGQDASNIWLHPKHGLLSGPLDGTEIEYAPVTRAQADNVARDAVNDFKRLRRWLLSGGEASRIMADEWHPLLNRIEAALQSRPSVDVGRMVDAIDDLADSLRCAEVGFAYLRGKSLEKHADIIQQVRQCKERG